MISEPLAPSQSKVLAQLLGVTDDKMEVRNKKLAFWPVWCLEDAGPLQEK